MNEDLLGEKKTVQEWGEAYIKGLIDGANGFADRMGYTKELEFTYTIDKGTRTVVITPTIKCDDAEIVPDETPVERPQCTWCGGKIIAATDKWGNEVIRCTSEGCYGVWG